MRISRKCELVLLVSLLLVSLMALALVLNYSIWPSLPHEERVELRLVPDARIMRYDTPSAISTKTHKFTERNKGITVRHTRRQQQAERRVLLALDIACVISLSLPLTSCLVTSHSLCVPCCRLRVG